MEPHEVERFVNSLRSTFTLFAELPVPTIAVIDGAALGGGLELALCADLRLAGTGERVALGLPETGLAIIPGAGGTQRLPRAVGISQAKRLIFTGERLGPAEAEAIGLQFSDPLCIFFPELFLSAATSQRTLPQGCK